MGTTANEGEKYCLKWNDFSSNLSTAFQEMRNDRDFFDMTLVTDEAEIKCHKLVLGACSPHLRQIIKKLSGMSNPAIYLRGVQHKDIKNIIEFMYIGEVNVAQEDLDSFLGVAQDLCIKGLTQSEPSAPAVTKPETSKNQLPPMPPMAKRPRLSAPHKMDNDKQKVKQETPIVQHHENNAANNMETYEEYYEAGAIDDLGDDGKEDEQEELAVEINEYLTSMSGRTEEGRYRCLICGLTCRDLYNQREHLMTHMVRDDKFKNRLDKFMNSNVIKDPKSGTTTCLLCSSSLPSSMRKHFLSKRLREPKGQTSYVQLPDDNF